MPKRRKKADMGPVFILIIFLFIFLTTTLVFLYNTLPSFTYEIWAGTKMTTGDYLFLGTSQALYLSIWGVFWWDHKKAVRKYYLKKARLAKRRAQR